MLIVTSLPHQHHSVFFSPAPRSHQVRPQFTPHAAW
uniref:Uncharacterized protein n=1 Tax=Arundo donax TaxID=35708 RepID=A0A0A9CGM5_ARUDO